jgi:hypothetical protein
VISLPNAFAEFGAGEDTAGLLEENLEDIEFARRERDGLAGAGDAAVEDIHDEVAGLKEIGGSGRGAAAAEGFDAGDEFLHREGFGEVVVGAGFEAFDAVADFATGGEDEDARGTSGGAEARENGEPIETWQAEIEDDEIGRRGERGAKTLGAVGAGFGGVVATGERTDDVARELGFVFDDQDTHGAEIGFEF